MKRQNPLCKTDNRRIRALFLRHFFIHLINIDNLWHIAKKNTTPTNSAPTDSTSKIEAIKNLIFGENIEQYDSEFDTIRKEIKAKKELLENYIDEVRNELMQSIDSLSTDVNIRITDLEDSLQAKTEALAEEKVNKKELGKLLISLGEKISS